MWYLLKVKPSRALCLKFYRRLWVPQQMTGKHHDHPEISGHQVNTVHNSRELREVSKWDSPGRKEVRTKGGIGQSKAGVGEGNGTHSSTLAWTIPRTEEPGRLQSMELLRVGHDWATSLSLFTFRHWRRKWQPTPVFLPGESQRQEPGGLPSMQSHRVGHNWSDLAAAAAWEKRKKNTSIVRILLLDWTIKFNIIIIVVVIVIITWHPDSVSTGSCWARRILPGHPWTRCQGYRITESREGQVRGSAPPDPAQPPFELQCWRLEKVSPSCKHSKFDLEIIEKT